MYDRDPQNQYKTLSTCDLNYVILSCLTITAVCACLRQECILDPTKMAYGTHSCCQKLNSITNLFILVRQEGQRSGVQTSQDLYSHRHGVMS